MCLRIPVAASSSSWRGTNSTSMSLKSSSSSSRPASSSSRALSCSIPAFTVPRSCPIAALCAASEEAAIRSPMASAWVMSIRPAFTALRVNSPGCARRQPLLQRTSIAFFCIQELPWSAISTVSSEVNDRGARYTVATHWSISLPLPSVRVPRCAVCESAFTSLLPFHSESVISIAFGPLTRTRAMAPLPGAVEMAQIVSLLSSCRCSILC